MEIDIWELRHFVYQTVASRGLLPTRSQVELHVGNSTRAVELLRALHNRHLLVLDRNDEITMALPFAAEDTGHAVRSGTKRWLANCAWDALAIPLLLGCDAKIEARWLDTSEPVHLTVQNGHLSSLEGFVHFEVPAKHWWDDITET